MKYHESEIIVVSHDKEGLHHQINFLLVNELIQKQDNLFVLTDTGKK